VLGLLLEGAQRLQKEQATCAEERRLLQAREQGLAHVAGQERHGTTVVHASDEGESS
jgi:hypothetical protein